MKKEWKSNNYNNVRKIVEAHTHMSAEEFLHPQKDPYLHGLKEAVQFVKLKLRHKVPVHIVGDYDVDGEMSTAILELALETFGGYPVHVRLPRRFSEGYGLSMKIIDEISDGLMSASSEAYKIACIRAADMAIYDHSSSSPMYGDLNALVSRYHCTTSHASENIWKASTKTAAQIHTRFQANTGSRKVRMSSGYTEVGIAIVEKNNQTYVAEIYLK